MITQTIQTVQQTCIGKTVCTGAVGANLYNGCMLLWKHGHYKRL